MCIYMCTYVFDLTQSFTLLPPPPPPQMCISGDFFLQSGTFSFISDAKFRFTFSLHRDSHHYSLWRSVAESVVAHTINSCDVLSTLTNDLSSIGVWITCRCSISADVLYIISYHPITAHSSMNHCRDDSYELCTHRLYSRHFVCSCLIKENWILRWSSHTQLVSVKKPISVNTTRDYKGWLTKNAHLFFSFLIMQLFKI